MKGNIKRHLVQRNVVGRKHHVIVNIGARIVLGQQFIKSRHSCKFNSIKFELNDV